MSATCDAQSSHSSSGSPPPRSARAPAPSPADATTINLAQCTGTENAEVSLDDELEMELTWQVDMLEEVTFESGGTFQLWAANGPLAAGSSDSVTSCTEQPSGTTTDGFTVGAVGDELDAPSQTLSVAEAFSMQEIAAAAGYDSCEVESSTHTVYLCVQWSGPGSQVGWAKTTVTLDLRRPSAPTGAGASPGDGKLHVSCSAGSSNQTFKARADGAGESRATPRRGTTAAISRSPGSPTARSTRWWSTG